MTDCVKPLQVVISHNITLNLLLFLSLYSITTYHIKQGPAENY